MTETTTEVTRRRIGPRERALLILLGIVGLLAVAYVFLIAAGDGDDVAGPPTPQPRATPTAEPGEPPDETPAPRPPLTREAFEGRDPFQPLVVVVAPPPPGPGDGDDTPPPDDTATPTDGRETRRVTLLDIFTLDGERMATVRVDGQEFTVAEGDTFGDNFRAIELSRRCGTFVFGDERFTLCIGQEVRK